MCFVRRNRASTDDLKASVKRSGSRIFKDKASKSKLEMSLDYVFGKGTSKALKSQELEFEYSRRTGRLRYVVTSATGETLFTFRSNGSIAPTIAGAKMLLNPLPKIRSRPRWTVTVIDGVSQVVSQGKTVFCKHVAYCSNELKPSEDVSFLKPVNRARRA